MSAVPPSPSPSPAPAPAPAPARVHVHAVKLLQARAVAAHSLLPPHVKISAEALTALNALLTSLATALAKGPTSLDALLQAYLAGNVLHAALAALHQQQPVPPLWPEPATATAMGVGAAAASATLVANVHLVLLAVAQYLVVDLVANHCAATNTLAVRAQHVGVLVGACADLAPASVKLQWPTLLTSLAAATPAVSSPASASGASSSSASSVRSVSVDSSGPRDTASSPHSSLGDPTPPRVSDAMARASTSLQSFLDAKPSDPPAAAARGRPVDRRLSYRPLVHSLSTSPARHSPTSPASSSASSSHFTPAGGTSPPPPVPVVPEFDDLIQSSQTVKFSLTPTRIKSLDTSPTPPPPRLVERGRQLSVDTAAVDPLATPTQATAARGAGGGTWHDAQHLSPSPLSTIDGSPMDPTATADSPTTPTKKKKSGGGTGILAMFRSGTISSKSKKAGDTSKRGSMATSDVAMSTPTFPPHPALPAGLKKSASSAAMAGADVSESSPPRADPLHVPTRDAPPSPRSPTATASASDATGNRLRARSLSQPTSPRPHVPPHQLPQQEPASPPVQRLTVTTTAPTSPGAAAAAAGGGWSSVASSPTVVASPNTALHPPVPDTHLPPGAIRSRTASARTAAAGEIAAVVDLYCAADLGPSVGDTPVSPSSVTAVRHYTDEGAGDGAGASDMEADDDAQRLARRRFSPRSDSIQGTLALLSTSPTGVAAVGAPGWRRGSEPLTSPVVGSEPAAGLARSATCSPVRPRTHTFDTSALRAHADTDADDDDTRSAVSFASNVTNVTSMSSRHPSSVGSTLPTSWLSATTTTPAAPMVATQVPPHPRVPPLPTTLASLPTSALVSLIHSLHTHLTLVVHDVDAAQQARDAARERLDTLATRAVRKITQLQDQVAARDREIAELRAEVAEVRDRLERVVGLVASVVPRVVASGTGGHAQGHG